MTAALAVPPPPHVSPTEAGACEMPRGGEKFGAWFDVKAAQAAVDFFHTYLRHTEGEWWGRPFRLSAWQEKIVRSVFGWKRADGTRLVRQLYLEVPRKNGKTEFAAGLALLLLVADGEPAGQVYSMAVDKDQAKIVFNKAGTMVSLSPALSKAVEVYKTALYVAELMASFKPLSARPGGKHGFSPSGAVADELHEWPDGELHDVVHKGTVARRQPLEILITTAGEPGIGYGWDRHEYAAAVLRGDVEDPTFLAFIFAADAEDDWRDPATWAKANPNFGVSVKRDYLETEVVQAAGNPVKEADFKRFHLNIWNERKAGGIDMAAWDEAPARDVTLEALRGRRVWAALDLSSTTDLTALALAADAPDGGIDMWWRFWLPVKSDRDLRERAKRDRVDYPRWIAEGWIVATPGDVVDYDAVRACITGKVPHESHAGRPLVEEVDIVQLAIDRWNATATATQLMGDGIDVVQFGQGFASMAAPTKEFERLVLGRALAHGGNPVARWMAQCVSFIADGADNVKPVKPDRRRTPKRIDGIVAGIMALGVKGVAKPGDGTVEQGFIEV
jgi:phage terminase large subunit-like protein